MRLLFVHDHRFYRDAAGAVYTSGSLPAEIWDRYLAHFEAVQVIGRDGGPLPADANYALSSHLVRHRRSDPSVPAMAKLVLGSRPCAIGSGLHVEACECGSRSPAQ